ncbi:MAG: nicotinate phosphoribosyltransferase [Desulfobulbaceae bacterium BRH_c16a]|nr:MAG: nicotinate phosphoribosyltransferase [Desulfobulbaceae bacterium BRH_c16a]
MKRAHRNLSEGILMTDQYQLTMAQLYFRQGLHRMPAQFEYFYRNNPSYGSHQAGYTVLAGTGSLLEWMAEERFTENEIACLGRQRGRSGTPLFQPDFLDWLLQEGDFSQIRLQGLQEGRVAHPTVPLLTVQGPFAMAQILETSLLNHMNYQTLIATKAARMRQAANRRPILEFGLRRAQGYGGNAGVRGALVGGADASSNVGISHALGFDPKGTHAHSMVQAFVALGSGELGAFRAYAETYPDDCLLLVDTIDTLKSGIPNAIRVFEELRRKGHRPVGIRLDSGDLAYLTLSAAQALNRAGFADTAIVLSNQLDEMVIWQILSQIRTEAPKLGMNPEEIIDRMVFGVGTALITSQGAAALDGVYKLTAVKDGKEWRPAIKISETPGKIINPGEKQIWRLYDLRDKAVCDVLAIKDERLDVTPELDLHHPVDFQIRRTLKKEELSRVERLYTDLNMVEGGAEDTIARMRLRRDYDLERLDDGVKRMVNPHRYHVSLTRELWELKQKLVGERLSIGKRT